MRYITASFPTWEEISLSDAIAKVKTWPHLALDIETTGDFQHVHTQRVVLLQLTYKEDTVVITNNFKSVLRTILKKLVIGHNIKYDLQIIKNEFGYTFEHIYDTMLAAQVIECGAERKKGHFTLESVAKRYVNPLAYSLQGSLFESTVTKKIRDSFHKFDTLTLAQIDYGATDAEYTYRLYGRLNKILEKEDLMDTLKLELEFCKLLVDMELEGIGVNRSSWMLASNAAFDKLTTLQGILSSYKDLNWNSPKQILPYFKSLGVDTTLFDRNTGIYKETVAKTILESQVSKHEIIKYYLDYKKYQKQYSTYGEEFLDKHTSPVTNKIHSSFHQIMVTGRTSSSSPNLQNIPKSSVYRSAFGEKGWVKADFKAQELHIAASYAKEQTLLTSLREGKDPHLETAKLVYDDNTLTADSRERQYAKSINFLVIYGGGPSKLASTFNIPIKKAKDVIKKYFESYQAFAQYFKLVGEDAEEKGYILCDNYIRRKTYPHFYSKMMFAKERVDYFTARGWVVPSVYADTYSYWRSFLQRMAQNYRIQSTGATMAKLAGVLIKKELKAMKTDGKLVLLVHDEWVATSTEDTVLVAKIVKDSMEKASLDILKNIKIPADVQISDHW